MLPGRVGMWWSGDMPFKSQEISSLELFHSVTPDEHWRYSGYFEPSRDVRRASHWINREIKFDVTWPYVKRQTTKMTSEFVFFSSYHTNIEKCLLLFASNTNIFTLLFKELKTNGKSFIFEVCRLTYDHVTSNLISLMFLRSPYIVPHILMSYTRHRAAGEPTLQGTEKCCASVRSLVLSERVPCTQAIFKITHSRQSLLSS